MRVLCAATLLVVAGFSFPLSYAADISALPFTKTAISDPNDGTSSVIAFKRAAQRDNSIAKELNDVSGSFAIVFVPGILGSSLSDSKGWIWGQPNPFTVATDYQNFMERLKLPPELIDEKPSSHITANVLHSMFGMDFYGKAVDAMQSEAGKLHVDFWACGYDWRRDIRSGATELDNCINEHFKSPRRLIIIAHSMGGLVAWQWAMQHPSQDPARQHQLVQLVTLGSPLEGSCEIIRMIEDGYVQPTIGNKIVSPDRKQPLNLFENFATLFARIKDPVLNDVTSALTQKVRPVVLTWPGAIELSPRPTDSLEAFNCIPAQRSNQVASGKIVSYYDPAFWTMPLAGQLLGGYPLPSQYRAVLAKAQAFRDGFVPARLAASTWLYYSLHWQVPNQRMVVAGTDGVEALGKSIDSPTGWNMVDGDGRVPLTSAALASARQEMFSNRIGLVSPHGDLPADLDFRRDYFLTRLPKVLDTLVATALIQASAGHPAWAGEYAAAGGVMLSPSSIESVMSPDSGVDGLSQPEPAVQSAMDSATSFNASLCSGHPCVATLDAAIAATKAAPIEYQGLASVINFNNVAKLLEKTNPDYVYAEGRKGIALAQQDEWGVASKSFQQALDASETAKALLHGAQAEKMAGFQSVLEAGKARSLYESGYCKAAEPFLRKVASYDSFSRDALTRPCNDRAGVLFCFDTNDYCRKQ